VSYEGRETESETKETGGNECKSKLDNKSKVEKG